MTEKEEAQLKKLFAKKVKETAATGEYDDAETNTDEALHEVCEKLARDFYD